MRIITSLLLLLAVISYPTFSYSNTYKTDDGHTVELMWKVKHSKTFIAWGSVRGGKKCNNLHIGIGFENKNGGIKYVSKDTNRKYYPKSGERFKFEESGYKLKKKGWKVDDINIYCQDFYRAD